MMKIYKSYGKSPVGILEVQVQDEQLWSVMITNKEELNYEENALSKEAICQLKEYFAGKRTIFQLPLAPRGSVFQQEVWKSLATIAYGESRTYQQIAASINMPKAARAVGRAIGKNPFLIIIPCHRILGKNGSLTGFSAGLTVKKSLLELEKIPYSSK